MYINQEMLPHSKPMEVVVYDPGWSNLCLLVRSRAAAFNIDCNGCQQTSQILCYTSPYVVVD